MLDATNRGLVEAWGVRTDTRIYGEPAWLYPRTYGREPTDVPLIAVDRLTDEALVEVVRPLVYDAVTGYGPTEPTRVAVAILAALRAHLESQ